MADKVVEPTTTTDNRRIKIRRGSIVVCTVGHVRVFANSLFESDFACKARFGATPRFSATRRDICWERLLLVKATPKIRQIIKTLLRTGGSEAALPLVQECERWLVE